MTRLRNDNHSTEFGLWLRQQRDIDSRNGFSATNLDFIWQNYKTGQWMLIEEKRYNAKLTWSQSKLFQVVDSVARNDSNYYGFHVIVFEKTSPNDGILFIDHNKATVDDLIAFLLFNKPDDWYNSYYVK